MPDKEILIARARVIADELNKTLEAISNKGVTIDYSTYYVKQHKSDGVEGYRFEFKFCEITRVDL